MLNVAKKWELCAMRKVPNFLPVGLFPITRNVFEASSSVSTPSWVFGIKVGHNSINVHAVIMGFALIKIHIVCVKEGEDFFAIGNDVFTERPLRFLNVKQNQQHKLKAHNHNHVDHSRH